MTLARAASLGGQWWKHFRPFQLYFGESEKEQMGAKKWRTVLLSEYVQGRQRNEVISYSRCEAK